MRTERALGEAAAVLVAERDGPELVPSAELLIRVRRGFRIGVLPDRIQVGVPDYRDPAALRYIQMLIGDAPLRLLFVGGPKLYSLLMRAEFGPLRRSFVRYAAQESTAADSPLALPEAAIPVSRVCRAAQPGAGCWPGRTWPRRLSVP